MLDFGNRHRFLSSELIPWKHVAYANLNGLLINSTNSHGGLVILICESYIFQTNKINNATCLRKLLRDFAV